VLPARPRQHCNSIAPIYNRIATSMKTERRDIEFARVNCGKDQSVRPPTAVEMEARRNPPPPPPPPPGAGLSTPRGGSHSLSAAPSCARPRAGRSADPGRP
jgi:hypothetical protein